MARFGVERGSGGGRFSADREISGIFTELWKLDENRLTPGKHYRINLQRQFAMKTQELAVHS